jgi:RHS repeat-associated protein
VTSAPPSPRPRHRHSPLATLHGANVTNITIPATQTETTPSTTIGPWSDYTEFGTPRDTTATTTVAGAAGHGWLGTKDRSTTTESAGLTLMGDRLYNPTTGRFTSPDPEPGGSDTAYTYPTDPINMFDLDGNWWHRPRWVNWRNAARAATVVGFGICVFASAGACLAAGLAGAAVSARSSAGRWGGRKLQEELRPQCCLGCRGRRRR